MPELDESTNHELSEITKFYDGLSIFVTGGSGFLGILLIQKLLRECPTMSKMYLLVRPKKGKSPEERLEHMFQDPVFDKMKIECPNYIDKIRLVMGDLQETDLGLSEEDKKCLSEEVNVIFHLAATVRFDENLKKAALINIKGSMELLNIAKTCAHLKALVHCSTSYSYYPRDVIDEILYDVPYSTEKLLHIINVLSDEELECLTQKILSTWPNTYVFTKALAENVIKERGKNLPITIVRPAVVTSTVNDPLEGWVNNLNGPVGYSAAVLYGVLRVTEAREEVPCNFVPGDYVVNNIIVAAQYIGTTFNKQMDEEIKSVDDIPIFNCVSQFENNLTWEEFRVLGYKSVHWAPSDALWYITLIFFSDPYLLKAFQFLLETIPAYLIDFTLVIQGKKAQMVKLVRKIHYQAKFSAVFPTKSWIFLNYNNQKLWNRLNNTDKMIFQFSMKNIDWAVYIPEIYAKGLYLYCLKKTVEDLPKARARYPKLKYLHFTVVYSFYILCVLIIFKLLTVFVQT